ncbi:peptide chain release factor 1 [Candidatus Amarolinea aalborgensis]|jgi:peptide chain release factor 1|uniref:peptide chain release factor 1 n=1 Tax=Candidatus Amarolinea aalborgensis TaxID=2249329 RepID=UPI003BF9659E
MFEKLESTVARYQELTRLLGDPALFNDNQRAVELAQEHASLTELVETYQRYRQVVAEQAEAIALLNSDEEPDLVALAREEIGQLEQERADLEARLHRLLVPKDPNDERDVIVEIRAGTGGDEAGLFAADLFRMYTRYAENHNWKVDLLNSHESGIGGFKEVIFEVRGRGAYSRLKYESGVHRVQRVPTTESQGRIHTSTATVAVLPEMDEVEVDIRPDELRIDVFRAGGPGGQSVNTTDSAVRITHLPTGIVVSSQDQKSQLQNKVKGMQILRARLYDAERRKQNEAQEAARRSQVGSGERAEKIRTYNFPQNRVTDHRIGKTLYQLETVLTGDLDEFINELSTADQAERLQAASESDE